MMNFNKKHLQELKQLECKLKSKLLQHNNFKRIYESNNETKKEDWEIFRDKVLIENPEIEDMINNMTDELADYLKRKDKTINEFITRKSNIIEVNNYNDILKTIHTLINILEFDLAHKELLFEKIYTANLPPNLL